MNIGLNEITGASTLLGIAIIIYKIIFGQGKARAREDNFVREIGNLKEKDIEFSGDIRDIKGDITEIKINQEQKHGELKQGLANLEINILKEFRKQNGGNYGRN